MDILIKSFNRPYYLDRCIKSIQLFVDYTSFNIIILDDGTPELYLEKLKQKYPFITIFYSKSAKEKQALIKAQKPIFKTEIPIDLWIEIANISTDYFLLLEDDFWFTKKVDLAEFKVAMHDKQIKMIKLFWLGNSKLLAGHSEKLNEFISFFLPKVTTLNPFIYKAIFKWYKFKYRKILSFFSIYSDKKALQYYSIYAVAGAIFEKTYFLSLWKNHQNTVDESLQIRNALNFISNNKSAKFGNSTKELLKTGFMSSASNQHKPYKDVNLDVFNLNYILNEAWYNNNFDPMRNFPNDLDENEIEFLLTANPHPNTQSSEWKKWVKMFKNQYTSFGCIID